MSESPCKTFCRNCIAACGMDLDIKDNQIAEFRGDRSHPLSRGYKCIKGLAAIEFVNHKDRLLTSLKRSSDGRFTKIESHKASREVGALLKEIVAENGPKSVAMYAGTAGHFNTLGLMMGKAWLEAIGSPNFFTSRHIGSCGLRDCSYRCVRKT